MFVCRGLTVDLFQVKTRVCTFLSAACALGPGGQTEQAWSLVGTVPLFAIVLWVLWTKTLQAFRSGCLGGPSLGWKSENAGTKCFIRQGEAGICEFPPDGHCAGGRISGESASPLSSPVGVSPCSPSV